MASIKPPSLFAPALGQFQSQPAWSFFGPQPFQGYLAAHGLQAKQTASFISVNSYGDLGAALAASDAMVFQFGASDRAKRRCSP